MTFHYCLFTIAVILPVPKLLPCCKLDIFGRCFYSFSSPDSYLAHWWSSHYLQKQFFNQSIIQFITSLY